MVEKYFHVDIERRSIVGYSMGGNGALIHAAKRPDRFRSVTAFCPIGWPTKCDKFSTAALTKYLGSAEAGADYSITDILNAKGSSLKLPPGYVDCGSVDEYFKEL